MGLSRRGILGGLAGGVVAGPAAVKEAMNTTHISPDYGIREANQFTFGKGVSWDDVPTPSEPLHEIIRKAYQAGLISKETILEALFQDGLPPAGEKGMDPEFHQNKSFSVMTKLRLSRDAQIERRLAGFLSGSDDRSYMSGIWDLVEKLK